jgi:hypothetical protein
VRACLPTPSAFDVSTSLTVSTPVIYARLLGTSAPGVHPSKFFPLTLSRPAVAFGTRAVPSACLSARRWSLPTCRFRMCRPTNKFAVSRIRVGFWALLPLRVRQPPAGLLGPRTVRCSPGFCLSKDFALPARSPFSRAFRSRACPNSSETAGATPQRFALRRGQLSLAAIRGTTLRIIAVGMLPFLRFCARVSA